MDFSDNPERMYLANFGFRTRERFLYEYDFGDAWLHEVRIEKRLPLDPKQTYHRDQTTKTRRITRTTTRS